MSQPTEYQGTKLQDLPTTIDENTIINSKILIVTNDGQHLVTFNKLVQILRAALR